MNELENCINDRESMEMCMNMGEIFARVSGVVDVDLAELNPTITSHPMIHTHFSIVHRKCPYLPRQTGDTLWSDRR
jgi:hypothetical protein